MNDKRLWGYLSNIELDKLNRHAYNIQGLYEEIQQNVVIPSNLQIDANELFTTLKNIVVVASILEARLDKCKIDSLNGSELEIMLPALTLSERSFTLSEHSSKALVHQLKQHPNFNEFALSSQAVIINRNNATALFEVMDYTIDPMSKDLTGAQKLFNDLRLSLSDSEHKEFFNCAKSDPGPYLLKNPQYVAELMEHFFDPSRSSYSLLSHHQLWKISQKLSKDENLQAFGVEEIKLEQDTDLNKINWLQVIQFVKHHKIQLEFEPYQYRRYVKHLTLNQAFALDRMKLNKMSGFGVNSLQSACQYMAYSMQSTGMIMKLLSIAAGGIINWSVIMQRAIFMPVLAVFGVFSAKQSYDADAYFEKKSRKSTVLAFFRASKTRLHINDLNAQLAQTQQQLQNPKAEHLNHNKLSHYLVFKAILKEFGFKIPKKIQSIEQEHLDAGLERELLFRLIQATINSDNLVRPRPLLNDFVEQVQAQIPKFLVFNRAPKLNANYKQQNKQEQMLMMLKWAAFKNKWHQHLQKIQPFVNPTLNSLLFIGMSLFIVTLFTTATIHLIVSAIVSTTLGIMVWGISYISDKNKTNINAINNQALAEDNKSLRELDLIAQHKKLCGLINDLTHKLELKNHINPENDQLKPTQTIEQKQRQELEAAKQEIARLRAENTILKQIYQQPKASFFQKKPIEQTGDSKLVDTMTMQNIPK